MIECKKYYATMSPPNKTKRKLTSLFKKAMGSKRLPKQFSCAVNLIAACGLPPEVFDVLPPLRHIIVNPTMAKTPYLGCYFPERLEVTPDAKKVDWKKLGWDGQPYMMLFPTVTPEVWVILHEFAHYLDDGFIRVVDNDNGRYMRFGTEQVKEFCALKLKMRLEYETTHKLTRKAVVDCKGLAAAEMDTWWKDIPEVYLRACTPTDYAMATFTEWFAECFQTWCIHREWSSLPDKAPHTAQFLQHLCSEKISLWQLPASQ